MEWTVDNADDADRFDAKAQRGHTKAEQTDVEWMLARHEAKRSRCRRAWRLKW